MPNHPDYAGVARMVAAETMWSERCALEERKIALLESVLERLVIVDARLATLETEVVNSMTGERLEAIAASTDALAKIGITRGCSD